MESTPQPPAGPASGPAAPPPSPWLKLALELGPLAIFFAANAKFGIFAGTGAFMVAIVIALVASWRLQRRLPVMALVTAAIVLVFGGLTLALEDETFIKLKPTVLYALCAAALAVGLTMRRFFLRTLLESAVSLTDAGWRILTLRWIAFFVFLAIANEFARRVLSTDAWVSFKVFAFVPAVLVFAVAQAPLLRRHEVREPAAQ
jgi:intracellular septation protein